MYERLAKIMQKTNFLDILSFSAKNWSGVQFYPEKIAKVAVILKLIRFFSFCLEFFSSSTVFHIVNDFKIDGFFNSLIFREFFFTFMRNLTLKTISFLTFFDRRWLELTGKFFSYISFSKLFPRDLNKLLFIFWFDKVKFLLIINVKVVFNFF